MSAIKSVVLGNIAMHNKECTRVISSVVLELYYFLLRLGAYYTALLEP